jgi:hypothetical protein
MRYPDVVEHPDTDRLLVVTGPPVEGSEFLLFNRGDRVPARLSDSAPTGEGDADR